MSTPARTLVSKTLRRLSDSTKSFTPSTSSTNVRGMLREVAEEWAWTVKPVKRARTEMQCQLVEQSLEMHDCDSEEMSPYNAPHRFRRARGRRVGGDVPDDRAEDVCGDGGLIPQQRHVLVLHREWKRGHVRRHPPSPTISASVYLSSTRYYRAERGVYSGATNGSPRQICTLLLTSRNQ